MFIFKKSSSSRIFVRHRKTAAPSSAVNACIGYNGILKDVTFGAVAIRTTWSLLLYRRISKSQPLIMGTSACSERKLQMNSPYYTFFHSRSCHSITCRVPSVLITGQGFPPLAVRACVFRLAQALCIPTIGLVDCNPFGEACIMAR